MSFQFTSSGTMKLAQFTTETCLNFMNFVGMIVQRTLGRVSVQGVESLWGDCRFILADWGS